MLAPENKATKFQRDQNAKNLLLAQLTKRLSTVNYAALGKNRAFFSFDQSLSKDSFIKVWTHVMTVKSSIYE